MASSQVNGEVPHSAFIDHLLHYPAVNDGVKTVKTYLETPYQYVSPYVKKADYLGDKTLSKVEQRFPIVKKQPAEIYEDGRNLVLLPYRTVNAAKDHVWETYNGEVQKVGGDNLLTYGKALITTSLVVTGEVFQTMSGFLSHKKEQTKGVMDDATAKWQNTANDLAGKAGRFAEAANRKAQTKLDDVSSGADSIARKVGHNAEDTADYAMEKADDVSGKVDRATAQARAQAKDKAADAARTVADAAASVSTGADRVAAKADKKASERK